MSKIFLRGTFFSRQNSQGEKDALLNEFPRSTCFRKLSYLFRRGYRRHAVAKLCFKLKLYAVLHPGSYSAVIRAKCAARMFPFTNPEPGWHRTYIHVYINVWRHVYKLERADVSLAAWRARVSAVMRCIKFQYSSPTWRLIIIHIYITSALWRSHTSIRKLDIQMWPYFVTDALCKLIAN